MARVEIGQPVEIDSIVTGWDGWNPKLSIRGFRVLDRAGKRSTLFELPRVDLVVAWTSLPLLDLRLKELLIDSPRLSVRRDGAGHLHVAGIEMDSEDHGDDSAFADWLMRQPQIVVRDALVAWNDEMRRAPQLLLDHVQFRLEQRFGHHRAGLTGVPPAELAAPIDLRADVIGASLKDVQALRGKLYLRLDYADVAAWREWLPLPAGIESGKGALRVWIDFAQRGPPTSSPMSSSPTCARRWARIRRRCPSRISRVAPSGSAAPRAANSPRRKCRSHWPTGRVSRPPT